jgi:anti-sigma B factor antagonist
MEINIQIISGISVVSVIGNIDALTSDEVANALTSLVAQGQVKLVLDLGKVSFMSSAGLRAILVALKETRSHNGDLRLADAQLGVDKVLQLSSFTTILKCFPSVDQAVKSYQS